MNDIRRSVLWVIFGFCMVMLWDKWQVYNGHKALFFPSGDKVEAQMPASSTQPGVTEIPQSTTALSSSQVMAGLDNKTQPPPSRKRVDIETNVLKLSFDSAGGNLVRAELLAHKDINHPGDNVVLFNDSPERVYEAQSGLISKDGVTEYPTHKTVMLQTGQTKFVDGEEKLTLKFESPEISGIKLIKT